MQKENQKHTSLLKESMVHRYQQESLIPGSTVVPKPVCAPMRGYDVTGNSFPMRFVMNKECLQEPIILCQTILCYLCIKPFASFAKLGVNIVPFWLLIFVPYQVLIVVLCRVFIIVLGFFAGPDICRGSSLLVCHLLGVINNGTYTFWGLLLSLAVAGGVITASPNWAYFTSPVYPKALFCLYKERKVARYKHRP